ncbi:MAG: type II secretion system protein N [Pseudomonadales bacterium]|jgi:general secretion pathway protein C
MELSQVAARLVEPARWIVIAGIAFTLANAVLFFVSPPEGSSISGAGARAPVGDANPPAPVSINAILARNLFGEAAAGPAVVDNTIPAVETRLPLELEAVFVSEGSEASAAIVAQKGKAGELYAVGDSLPGNAELLEVHADHIVLRRAGARETLYFPQVARSDSLIGPVEEPDLSTQSYDEPTYEEPAYEDQAYEEPTYEDDAATPRDFVETYRDRIDADPQGALQEMGITPVAEGETQGYRLDDVAASSPYLSQTGLQPGDVVLSVNGQPVGNIEQDRRQIDNILAQGSARIEVQRGTRRFFVTASLKQ